MSAVFVHGEVILHVKPPLTWLSHWRLSRKTDPLSWSRPRGRKKAAGRRARAALHARGGGPILEDEEIRALRMRRRDGLPDQADRRHVNGGLTWRGDFREKRGSAIESACRARICRSSSPAAPASCEMPGSLPLVTGSDAGRARFALPLAGLFSARLPGPGGAVVLSQRHARSFPLAAVPLSHLAPAISMARNSRSTSRFQLCRSPNENAEVPAAFRNGHFECELSVGISLAACSVTLMAGSTCVRGGSRPANGIVGQGAADSTCAEMRSRALTARHLYLSAVGFYLYSKRFPRHLPNLT